MYKRATTKSKLVEQTRYLKKQLGQTGSLNNNEGEEEVRSQLETLQEKLKKCHDDELEIVQSGGDAFLTCQNCFYTFSTYRGYQGHQCQLIMPEEVKHKVQHFRVLEGQDREDFLDSTKFLSFHRKLQLCVATRTACRDVFPLVFPRSGDTSTSHLRELGLVGDAAYTLLGRALKDGPVHLPSHLVLDLPDGGGELYLPPSLLTPRTCAEGTSPWRSSMVVSSEEEELWMEVKLPGTEEEEEEEDLAEEDLMDDSEDEDDGQWWGTVEGGGPARPPGGNVRRGRRQGGDRPTAEDRLVSNLNICSTISILPSV